MELMEEAKYIFENLSNRVEDIMTVELKKCYTLITAIAFIFRSQIKQLTIVNIIAEKFLDKYLKFPKVEVLKI